MERRTQSFIRDSPKAADQIEIPFFGYALLSFSYLYLLQVIMGDGQAPLFLPKFGFPPW